MFYFTLIKTADCCISLEISWFVQWQLAVQYAIYQMHYTIFIMQYAVCNMHYAIYIIQYSMFVMQYILYNMYFSICIMQYAFCKMHYVMYIIQYTFCVLLLTIWHSTYSIMQCVHTATFSLHLKITSERRVESHCAPLLYHQNRISLFALLIIL